MKFINFSVFLIISASISVAGYAEDTYKDDNLLYYIRDTPNFSQEFRKSAVSDTEKIDSKDIQPGPQITVNIIIENSPKMIKNVEHEEKPLKAESRRADKHSHYQQKPKHPFSQHIHNEPHKQNLSATNKYLDIKAVDSIVNFLKNWEPKSRNVSSLPVEEEMKNKTKYSQAATVRTQQLSLQIINGSDENVSNKLQYSVQKEEKVKPKMSLQFQDAYPEKTISSDKVEINLIGAGKNKPSNETVVKKEMQALQESNQLSDSDNFLHLSNQGLSKHPENKTIVKPGTTKQITNEIEFDVQLAEIGENDLEAPQNPDEFYGRAQPLVSHKERHVEDYFGHESASPGHQLEGFHPMLRELFKRELRFHRDSDTFQNDSKSELLKNKTAANENETRQVIVTEQAMDAKSDVRKGKNLILEDPYLKKDVLTEIDQDISNESVHELSPQVRKAESKFVGKTILPQAFASTEKQNILQNISEKEITDIGSNKLEEPKAMMSIDLKVATNETSALKKTDTSEFMKDYDEFELQKRRLPLLIAPPQPKAEIKSQPDFPGVWNRVLPYLAILKRDANSSDLTSPSLTD